MAVFNFGRPLSFSFEPASAARLQSVQVQHSLRTAPAPEGGRTEPRLRGEEVLVVLHAVVPGRLRLRVGGLYRSPTLKVLLERSLRTVTGVREARASITTGHLLVCFDPLQPAESLIGQIDWLVRREVVGNEEDAVHPPGSDWHRMHAAEVAALLDTDLSTGLSRRVALERLSESGRNVLPAPSTRSWAGILLAQFLTTPVALLMAASVLSVATGGLLEAAAILGVVLLNGAIGYATESRAERTIRSLGGLGVLTARVIRDGAQEEIPAETVVPGDLLCLQRGEAIPADARLVACEALTVSEALLTGESVPVMKSVRPLIRPGIPIGERVSMVFRGTVPMGGSGKAIVVATGGQTVVGRIQTLVGSLPARRTPMQRGLDDLGRKVVWLSLAVGGLVFAVGLLRGYPLPRVLRAAFSLAVASVPEGLPALATTTLAFGIDALRRRRVLVRRLDALETLARVRVVCFDKTGTLTFNRMEVACLVASGCRIDLERRRPGKRDWSGRDGAIDGLLRVAALCSETKILNRSGASGLDGSPTEAALVQAALDFGVDVRALRRRYPRLSLRQRTDAEPWMVTVHASGPGQLLITAKGSPPEILAHCSWEATPAGACPLTPNRRRAIARANARMARKGLRVLGFASREVTHGAGGPGEAPVDSLTWLGLAGLADPIRPGSRELITVLQRAGCRAVIMTGDQCGTARAVAEQLGIGNGRLIEVVDAARLDRMEAQDLAVLAARAQVFARVSPAQKLRILRGIQDASGPVAMVGDGINDSPALKAADVGIALGKGGAAAAREVADVVLETDDLTALIPAIERGRGTCANLKKSLHYLLSTNLSEAMVVLAGASGGVAEPLSPMQLLWINLISDVLPGLGLALEPPEPGILERGPDAADGSIVNSAEVRPLVGQAALLSAGPLAACTFGALRYGARSPKVGTMTFGSIVIAQLLHAVTCRSKTYGLFRPSPLPRNRSLDALLGLSVAVQAGGMLAPGVRRMLGVVPVGPVGLAVSIGAGLVPFLLAEAAKRPPLDLAHGLAGETGRAALAVGADGTGAVQQVAPERGWSYKS